MPQTLRSSPVSGENVTYSGTLFLPKTIEQNDDGWSVFKVEQQLWMRRLLLLFTDALMPFVATPSEHSNLTDCLTTCECFYIICVLSSQGSFVAKASIIFKYLRSIGSPFAIWTLPRAFNISLHMRTIHR